MKTFFLHSLSCSVARAGGYSSVIYIIFANAFNERNICECEWAEDWFFIRPLLIFIFRLFEQISTPERHSRFIEFSFGLLSVTFTIYYKKKFIGRTEKKKRREKSGQWLKFYCSKAKALNPLVKLPSGHQSEKKAPLLCCPAEDRRVIVETWRWQGPTEHEEMKNANARCTHVSASPPRKTTKTDFNLSPFFPLGLPLIFSPHNPLWKLHFAAWEMNLN